MLRAEQLGIVRPVWLDTSLAPYLTLCTLPLQGAEVAEVVVPPTPLHPLSLFRACSPEVSVEQSQQIYDVLRCVGFGVLSFELVWDRLSSSRSTMCSGGNAVQLIVGCGRWPAGYQETTGWQAARGRLCVPS